MFTLLIISAVINFVLVMYVLILKSQLNLAEFIEDSRTAFSDALHNEADYFSQIDGYPIDNFDKNVIKNNEKVVQFNRNRKRLDN